MDLFVDIKSCFTDTHTEKEVRYERDKERLQNQPEESSQGEEESIFRRDNNVRHFWPTGERFLDYMAYEAGFLKLSDIVALEDLMLQMKPSDKLEHALLRPEQSTWQFFIRQIIHKRTIYTVESIEIPYSGSSLKPALYEIARQPIDSGFSFGPV